MKKLISILVAGFALPLSTFAQGGYSLGSSGGGSSWNGGTVTSAISVTPKTNPLVFSLGGTYPSGTNQEQGDAIVFQMNDPGTNAGGNYSIGWARNGQQGAAAGARGDNQMWIGYNHNGAVSGDHVFGMNFENTYYTGGGLTQGEFYFVTQSGDGVLNRRPFGITPNWLLHNVAINFAAETVDFAASETDNGMVVQSSKPGGVITQKLLFSANTDGSLDFSQYRKGESGITHDFIVRGGENILGYNSDGTVGRLFGGRTTATIGQDNADGSQDITLFLGANTGTGVGLRYSHTPGKFQFQNASDGTWYTPAALNATNTFTYTGTASTPAMKFTGAPYAAGDTTTNKPQFLMEDAGVTSTNWSANGTYFGINVPSGFIGDFARFQANGGGYLFRVDRNGTMYASGFNLTGDGEMNNLSIHNTCKIQFSDGNDYNRAIQNLSSTLLGVTNGSSSTFRDLKLRDLYVNNTAFMVRGTGTWTDGAGAQSGTLTNAPAAGNPTKWISIDDNGTTRKIPTW